jgi:hypothetical protein
VLARPIPWLLSGREAGRARVPPRGVGRGTWFLLMTIGSEFSCVTGAQPHFGNIGPRLEAGRSHVANASGAEVFSFDAILGPF